MKIAFLKPPIGGILGLEMLTFVEPLGPVSIAGALEQEGHECKIIDLRIDGVDVGLEACQRFAPDIVGLQCNFTTERYRCIQLARKVRSLLPEAFILVGGFLAACAASFLDAAFAGLVGWGEGTYWELWNTRFFSNLLGNLTLVPLIVTWAGGGVGALRRPALRGWIEPALVTLGLLAISIVVFSQPAGSSEATPVLLYAPVPFLLWAAVRLGPLGTSTSLVLMLLLAVWGAIHGSGPFVAVSPTDSALWIQLFLIVLSIPLLLLTAAIEERERSKAALHSSEERFAKAFMSSPDAMVITSTRDGRIVEVNDRWERLFGYSRAQAVGSMIWELGMFASAKDAAVIPRCKVMTIPLFVLSGCGYSISNSTLVEFASVMDRMNPRGLPLRAGK